MLTKDKDFISGAVVKNLPASTDDMGSITRWGRSPGEGNCKPTSVFLPGEFHGQRSLAGYSPWDHRVGGN